MRDIIASFLFNIDGTFNWDLLATLFSGVSLIYVANTLHEMKKQRELSYIPFVIFNSEKVIVQKNDDGIPNILKKTLEMYNDFYPPQYNITLNNVGVASAVNININWKFDKEAIINMFLKYSKKSKFLKIDEKQNCIQMFYKFERNDSYYGYVEKKNNSENEIIP